GGGDGGVGRGGGMERRRAVTAGPGIPVVYAMTQPLGQDGPAVLPDDEGGGRAAAGHLLEAGRQRIGHITGPERFLAARRRAEGFGAALAAAGLRSRGGARFGEWSEQWGRDAAGKLLADQPETDASLGGSAQTAGGGADTLGGAGRAIPDDVALVGYDNWEPMALGAQPPLTSIDMRLEEVGRVAAGLLLAAIAGEPAHGTRTVPCRLVVRQSSR